MAPATLLPPSLEGWPVAGVSHDLDDVLAKTDVISLLRLQAERGSGEPSSRPCASTPAGYGLTARRARHAARPGRSSCTRARSCGGWRSPRTWPSCPAGLDHRAGEQRGGRADGRRSSCSSGRAPLDGEAHAERASGSRRAELVIRGGTVVDRPGSRRADVLVADGAVVEVDEPSRPRPGPPCSTPAAASSPRAWSICTPTCASRAARRPRRSRPGPGPPRSAGTPRWWPCPTPTRRSTRPRRSATCSSWPQGPGPGGGGRGHHRGPGRRAAGPDGRAGRPRASASSPTTVPGCSRPG